MPSGSALGGLAERLAAIGSAGEDGVDAADSSPSPGGPGVLVHSPSTEVGNAGLPTGGVSPRVGETAPMALLEGGLQLSDVACRIGHGVPWMDLWPCAGPKGG
eukprot:scaffold2660_cov107-Skeletonema_menzelii.AAC.1